MTAAQYRNALAQVGLTPTAAARLLGIYGRTSRRYASRGIRGGSGNLAEAKLTRRISAGDVSNVIVTG
jgi:hypothetical protein